MNHLIDLARGAFGNPLIGGAFVIGLAATALATLKSLPSRFGKFVGRQFVVTVDVHSGESVFAWLADWLDAQPYSQRSRTLIATAHWLQDRPSIRLTPGPGRHVFMFRNRPVWLVRTRQDAKEGSITLGVRESLTLRTFGRSQEPLRALLDEARIFAQRQSEHAAVYVAHYSSWKKLTEFLPRALDTVVLPEGLADGVLADVEQFRAAREWYQERGIPWRRSYMLQGIPGSGKTSLINALAGAARFNVYVINLASRGMSDENLMSLLLDVPVGAAVLLEDIDSVVKGRTVTVGDKETGITFSGLLNAIDGVATRPGLMLWMTTNHPEKLDPALVRPGRVDVRIEFGPATFEQIERYFRRFYATGFAGDADLGPLAKRYALVMASRGVAMAAVQQHLLEHRHAPHLAVEDVAPGLTKAAA